MDAKNKLRVYLEQRRDLGESELVLDSMTVEEALRAIGAGGHIPSTPSPGARATEGASDWRTVLAPTPPVIEAASSVTADGIIAGDENAELFSSDIGRMPSLEVIRGAVEACTRCPLHKTATRGVPGEGAARARLVCVGEAPGATEDETGEPFVGAAGQLLTKILAAVDLPREEVFITNVIKHRPPGNRNPMPGEIEACTPYLVRQLELINPKVIVAFGTFAAQTLLNTKAPIGKLRGEVHRYHGIPLVVTYHPAALLRNPSWKRPTWEDVKLARRILDSATGA
jgi:DNA polymerase